MPNSIEWVQAVLAAWKLGAVPQPLSARLPDAELAALLELQPPALLVGRDDPQRRNTQRGRRFHARSARCPTRRCPRWCRRCGRRWHRAAAPGRPKLIEAGGDSRFPAALAGYALGRAGGRRQPALGAAEPQHRLRPRSRSACCMGHHLVLMPRFEPHEFLRLVTEHRVDISWRRCRRSCSACCRCIAPTPTPTTCRRSGGSGTWPRRARRRSSRRGSTCSARRWSGNCTAAPNYRR